MESDLSEDLEYTELSYYTKNDCENILKEGDINQLRILTISLGENFSDWKYAQNVCLELSSHEDEWVRGNALLGLGYIARTHGKLEKHLVKPVIMKGFRDKSAIVRGQAAIAVDDINFFLKWKIADKHTKKQNMEK